MAAPRRQCNHLENFSWQINFSSPTGPGIEQVRDWYLKRSALENHVDEQNIHVDPIRDLRDFGPQNLVARVRLIDEEPGPMPNRFFCHFTY